jgi:hypothetical protein
MYGLLWMTVSRSRRDGSPRNWRPISGPRRSAELSSRWKLGAGKRGRLRLITCRFELKRSKAGQQSGNA